MRGVKQNVDGGLLEHHATEELIQVGNTMGATNGGKILNEARKLTQIDNIMSADQKGIIINRTYKKFIGVSAVIIAIGLLADLISLYNLGVHLWEIN